MKRLITLCLICVSIVTATEKPNIILIFVDDLGYGDLGCYGNTEIATPNVDKLAAEGQRWTSFYASGSTCVPSRTGLMSGRHPALLGSEPLKNDRDALLPAMLNRQGYATAILGKWHLAGYPEDFTKSPMHPLECGFDYHFGTPGSNDAPGPPLQTREAFDHATSETWKIPLIRGRQIVEDPADQSLFTKRYTEEAVQWIQDKKDQPFFLYLAHNMPHVPIFPSEDFQGKERRGDIRRRSGRDRLVRWKSDASRGRQRTGKRNPHYLYERQWSVDGIWTSWGNGKTAPGREIHFLGGRLPRPSDFPLARKDPTGGRRRHWRQSRPLCNLFGPIR